jgi:hypothetical protein
MTAEGGIAMAASSAPFSVEQLLKAVENLPPARRREFQRRLAAREAGNGDQAANEASLIRAARARLPAAAERRLKRLIAKSERGELTPKELADYQALAGEVQRIDATRAEALAELARRRGRSVQAVKAELGKGDRDGA